MKGLRSRILDHAASVLPPALVLLLLGIQVAFGLRGFDRPDDSLLYVLQVPGVLLGWGGVALLVPLLAWMIMDWWGYDLNGFALKGLGSAVLGIALGTLVGIAAGRSGGGLVGAGLAEVLVATLGSTFAVVLMLLMAGPAGVLALSMQRRAVRPPRARAAPAGEGADEDGPTEAGPSRLARFLGKLRPTVASLDPEESRPWYPERRYDAQGNELPIQFGRERDIGGIRFADEDEPEEAEVAAAGDDSQGDDSPDVAEAATGSQDAEDEERLPTIPELLSGRFDRARLPPADEEGEEEAAAPDRAPADATAPPPGVAAPGRTAAFAFVQAEVIHDRDATRLMPGVRYADEQPQPPASDDGEPPGEAGATRNGKPGAGAGHGASRPTLSASIQNAVRGPARTAREPSSPGGIDALRDTLRTSFAAMGDGAASQRYLAKLEAIGMFEAAGAPPTDAEPPPARAEAATRPARARRKPSARARAGSKQAASQEPTPPQADTTGAPPTEAGAQAATPRKAAPRKAARKTDVTRKAATKKAPSTKAPPKQAPPKRAASKKAPTKKAATKGTRPKQVTSKAAATTEAPPRKAAAKADATKKTATKRARPRKAASKTDAAKQAAPGRAASGQARAATSGPGTPADHAAEAAEAKRRAARLAVLQQARSDPLFVRAVETALERGAASPVLYTRRLGLDYDRACAMVERLRDAGVLGEPTASGAHPVALSRDDWDATG